MAKEIKYDMDARDLLKKGVDELANAVKVTLRYHREEIWCSSHYEGWCNSR